jgi:hypothetical protein
MPVDTLWHWYWALLRIRRLLPLHILRGPKNEKGEQLEALIEASGHFPSRVAEIVLELRLGHNLQWPSTQKSTILEIESVDFLLALIDHEQRRIIRQKAYPTRPVTS